MNQLQKEVTINENFNAVSIAGVFAWDGNSGGLEFNYYGGKFKTQDGILSEVDDGFVLLTDNSENWIYFDFNLGEVVAIQTNNIPQDCYEIAWVETLNGVIADYEDLRSIMLPPRGGIDVPRIFTIETSQQLTTVTLTATALSAPILADTLYHIEANVVYECNAQNNDLKLGFTSPADSIAYLTIEIDGVKKLLPYNTEINIGELSGSGVGAVNSTRTAKIKGLLKTGANAGSFDILGALVASGDIITLNAGLLFIVRVA